MADNADLVFEIKALGEKIDKITGLAVKIDSLGEKIDDVRNALTSCQIEKAGLLSSHSEKLKELFLRPERDQKTLKVWLGILTIVIAFIGLIVTLIEMGTI